MAYDSSGEEDSAVEKRGDEAPSIDPEESASVFSKLKEKFSLESAPNVPNKVGNNWNRTLIVVFVTILKQHYSLQESEAALLRIDPSAKEVAFNPTYDQMFAPEVRPHPQR